MRFIFIFFLFFSSPIFANTSLDLGQPAPQLKVEKWLKGTPIEKFEPGRIYIVEFWATWCTPCVMNIPHLNEIAKKYGKDITVIGIAADQQADDGIKALAEVEDFIKKNDPAMDYAVAFDSTGETKKLWTEAANQHGIPSAFVVDRNGIIAFIGHPANMESEEIDNPLKMILAGTWQESVQLAKYWEKEKLTAMNDDRYVELITQFQAAEEKKDWMTAYSVAMQGAWMSEPHGSVFLSLKTKILIEHFDRPHSALPNIKKLVENDWESAQGLGNILQLMVHDKMPIELRDQELGERVAKRALDLSTNHPEKVVREKYAKYAWILLPAIAEYYFKTGRADLALDIQKSALKTVPDDEESAEAKAKIEKDFALYSEHFEKSQNLVATSHASAPTAMICKDGICYLPVTADCEDKLK